MTTSAVIALEGVQVYYGKSHILHGVSFEIPVGEISALLGRNGVGKTTTIQTILGLPPPRQGRVLMRGEPISGLPMYEIVRRGIGWVPQGRRIFTTLTVEENLILAKTKARQGAWTLETIYEHFPVLEKTRRKLGGTLSGGEQQMLAIGRALIQNPDVLLMDEPSEGLAPMMADKIGEIVRQLRDGGCSILIVEQNLAFTLSLASKVLVMSKGEIVFSGTAEMLSSDQEVCRQFLGVSATVDSRLSPSG
jgi:branched-chain amino acid transport system ATP-binding protein